MSDTTASADTAVQELEGTGEDDSSDFKDYPLDSVFVRTENRSVQSVIERIRAGRYVLDPDFQRDFVWELDKQSKLIESCIIRIPLPVFYVAEATDGRIMVVDGLQRLTTFDRYLSDKFALTGLGRVAGKVKHEFDGKRFSELPIALQERIQDTQLVMYILDAKAPERAKLDIFERVNSGTMLTRQQMRNAIFNGAGTRWLRDAAHSSLFVAATGHSLDPKSMRDREIVNRFCAFRLIGRKGYTGGDMDTFLAEGLRRLTNLPDNQRAELREGFERALQLNRDLFGAHAFRRSLALNDLSTRRTPLNVSLFETCTVTMFDLPAALSEAGRQALKKGLTDLLEDGEFYRSITYSTNSSIPVQRRFSAMEQLVGKVALTR
jgi:hypothetical protein